MNRLRSVLLLSTMVMLSGCRVFVPAHQNSHFKKGESTFLVLEESDPDPQPSLEAVAAAVAVVGALVDLGVKALDDEAKEYAATYGSTAASEFFLSLPSADQSPVVRSRMAPDATWATRTVIIVVSEPRYQFEVTLPATISSGQDVVDALNNDSSFKVHCSAFLDNETKVIEITTRPVWNYSSLLVRCDGVPAAYGSSGTLVRSAPNRAKSRLQQFTLVRYSTDSGIDPEEDGVDTWTTPGLTELERELGKATRVSYFNFGVQQSDRGDAFRITLERFRVRRAKAKVFDTRWWTRLMLYGCLIPAFTDAGDESIDITIKIGVNALWSDKNQLAHREQIASLEWRVSDYSLESVPVNARGIAVPEEDEEESGDTRETSQESDDSDKQKAGSDPAAWVRPTKNTKFMSDWISAPPVTVDTNGHPVGLGTYSITVSVVETDDFGDLIKSAGEGLADNKERIVERVERVVERVFEGGHEAPKQ